MRLGQVTQEMLELYGSSWNLMELLPADAIMPQNLPHDTRKNNRLNRRSVLGSGILSYREGNLSERVHPCFSSSTVIASTGAHCTSTASRRVKIRRHCEGAQRPKQSPKRDRRVGPLGLLAMTKKMTAETGIQP